MSLARALLDWESEAEAKRREGERVCVGGGHMVCREARRPSGIGVEASESDRVGPDRTCGNYFY